MQTNGLNALDDLVGVGVLGLALLLCQRILLIVCEKPGGLILESRFVVVLARH